MGMKAVIKIQQRPFRNDAVRGRLIFISQNSFLFHSIVEGRIVEGEQKLVLKNQKLKTFSSKNSFWRSSVFLL